MSDDVELAIQRHLATHHGVVTARQARRLGLSKHQVSRRLRCGRWRALHRGVYSLGGVRLSAETRLAAACAAAGQEARASHRSAAWLWGLLREPPATPAVAVPHSSRPRLRGVEVHRRRDHQAIRFTHRAGIPTTGVVRTIVDLAACATARELDDAIDVALARRLVKLQALRAEVRRLSRSGRRGPRQLRAALQRRGLAEPPAPSVLESRVLRLLRSWGLPPQAHEVVVLAGRYRLDFLLAPTVALEVDGFAYHSSPEAKAADNHRRNLIQATGKTVVGTDWLTVTRHPEQLRRDVLSALAAAGWRPPERPTVRRHMKEARTPPIDGRPRRPAEQGPSGPASAAPSRQPAGDRGNASGVPGLRRSAAPVGSPAGRARDRPA